MRKVIHPSGVAAAVPQRRLARVSLVVIGLVVALLLASSGIGEVNGALRAFAQSTGTGATIEILNPDSSTSQEVSIKSDGQDSTYHLVAWVSSLPAEPVVEFKYIASGSNQPEISINCAETSSPQARFVPPDTFDCGWNLQGISDGSGTVRAVLYSQGTQVASDEQAVTIDSDGQTVEIVYPQQAGDMGFYTGKDGIASGMIDVRSSAPEPPPPGPDGGESTSTAHERIDVYYSMAPPGQEPAFDLCGSKTVAGGTQESVRCDLPADDNTTTQRENDPNRVTAIAAVAVHIVDGPVPPAPDGTDADLEEDTDSADAHRAFGYEQDPGSVLVDPQTHSANPGVCSSVISATVYDTRSRQVVGVNVDVHAQGATDNLFFDDATGTNTTPNQAPESHATEPAADCEDTTPPVASSGTQGQHDQLGADVKHIESAAGGTEENGAFRFQLYSPEPQTAQFTAWADEDDDDTFCSAEPSGNGSVGWGQQAPSPTGIEPGPCPNPTGTATSSPTQTGSPTGTGTTGPSTDRRVTLAVDKANVVAGNRFTFSGVVLSNDQSCSDNEFVRLRRRVHGTNRYEDLFSTQTDEEGNFSVSTRQRRSADYIAIAPAHDDCQEETSSAVTVLIRVKMQILASDRTPERGQLVRIKSSVRPQHDGTNLILQRKKGQRWVRFMVDKMNRRSIGNFVFRVNFKVRRFRTVWRSQDDDHHTGRSRAIRLRAH